MARFSENIHVAGTLTADVMNIPANSVDANSFKANAEIEKSHHKQRVLDEFPLDLANARFHDAPQTVLSGSSSGDDLAIKGTTYGTDSVYLTPENAAGLTIVRYARWPAVVIPLEFDDAQTMGLRVRAHFQTEAADGNGDLDISAHKVDGDGAVGADLVTTAQQNANSLIATNYDFTVDASGLVPGDVLDVRLKLDVSDTSGTTVDPLIGDVRLRCDTRG